VCIDQHIHVAAGEHLGQASCLRDSLRGYHCGIECFVARDHGSRFFSSRGSRKMIPNCRVNVHRLARKRHWLRQKRSLANHCETEIPSPLRQINHHKPLSVWLLHRRMAAQMVISGSKVPKGWRITRSATVSSGVVDRVIITSRAPCCLASNGKEAAG